MPVLGYHEFLRSANETLRRPENGGRVVAGLVVAFEGLAELDGVLGYAAVDELMHQAGERLVEALHETDLVGYTGRHQLGCLLDALPGESHAVLAAHKILRTLAAPFRLGERRLVVAPRLGVAVSDHLARDAGELLRRANTAMRQARREREPLKVYAQDADELMLLGLDLWGDLGRAIEESELYLVYQPQLVLATGKIEGAEALLRWTHPQRGPIRPDIMVHVAEGTELISKLTLWVFNTALRQCAEYRRAGLDVGVSINFSAGNLREPDLVDLVAQGLDLWGVPAERIVIELTETAVMEEHRGSLEALNRFKEMGLGIAMDDFGTGYSSMARLRELPLDELKIDISFIRHLAAKPAHERIVDSMIGLSHKLGMRVVAEGVEDAVTRERLRALGCDMIQGYLIGRPMAFPDFVAAVSAHNRGGGA